MGPYSASKAALTTMLESVRNDLSGSGVRIVTVCPGFIESEITSRNDPRDMPMLLDTMRGAARILRGIDRGQKLVHFPRRLTYPLKYIVGALPPGAFDLLMRYRRPLPHTPGNAHDPPVRPESPPAREGPS
jgi:short-subunit dehydrogenase